MQFEAMFSSFYSRFYLSKDLKIKVFYSKVSNATYFLIHYLTPIIMAPIYLH